MGMIYKRGNVSWIKYYRNGASLRESSGSDKETVAKNLLKQREGDIVRGIPVTPQMNRCKIDELFADVLTDYRVNGKRSLANVERRVELHLTPAFGGRKAANINVAEIRACVDKRQAAGAKNATINRELAVLKRAFSLGIESSKVTLKPKIRMLSEDNVRTGFFERGEFEAVGKYLPRDLEPAFRFAYVTGWRDRSEVFALQWRQVDFDANTVRLDPGRTKNKEGRVFPFTAELRKLLEEQRRRTTELEREQGRIIPCVFHRQGNPVRDFYGAWRSACKKAGLAGRIPHDFRRTAVRNLVRAGVPERVAMAMTGHKTRSVFERYNIVSEGDLTEAAEKLDKFATGTV